MPQRRRSRRIATPQKGLVHTVLEHQIEGEASQEELETVLETNPEPEVSNEPLAEKMDTSENVGKDQSVSPKGNIADSPNDAVLGIRVEEPTEESKLDTKNVASPRPSNVIELRCQVCNCTFTNYHEHMNSEAHKASRGVPNPKPENSPSMTLSSPNGKQQGQKRFGVQGADKSAPPHKKLKFQEGDNPEVSYCEVCNLKIYRKADFEIHLNGKRHNVAVQKAAGKAYCERCYLFFNTNTELNEHMDSQLHKTNSVEKKPDHVMFFCDICQISSFGQRQRGQHLDSKRHKRMLTKRDGPFESTATVNAAALNSNPVNGRVHVEEPKKKWLYVCNSCDYHTNDDDLLKTHMNQVSHKTAVAKMKQAGLMCGTPAKNTALQHNPASGGMLSAKASGGKGAVSQLNSKPTSLVAATTSQSSAKITGEKGAASQLNSKAIDEKGATSQLNAKATAVTGATSQLNAKTTDSKGATSQSSAKAAVVKGAISNPANVSFISREAPAASKSSQPAKNNVDGKRQAASLAPRNYKRQQTPAGITPLSNFGENRFNNRFGPVGNQSAGGSFSSLPGTPQIAALTISKTAYGPSFRSASRESSIGPFVPPGNFIGRPEYAHDARENYRGDIRKRYEDDFHGPPRDVRSGIRGDIHGSMHGDLRADFRGDIQSEVRGDLPGNQRIEIPGDLRGDLRPDVRSDLRRDLRDLRGNFLGDIRSDLRPNLHLQPRADFRREHPSDLRENMRAGVGIGEVHGDFLNMRKTGLRNDAGDFRGHGRMEPQRESREEFYQSRNAVPSFFNSQGSSYRGSGDNTLPNSYGRLGQGRSGGTVFSGYSPNNRHDLPRDRDVPSGGTYPMQFGPPRNSGFISSMHFGER